MASSSPTAYPAEYYYPEFIDSRPDDPLKSPSSRLPLSTAVDNGIGSSTKSPTNGDYTNGITTTTTKTAIKQKPINKKQTTTGLALDVITDQGLPDADITQAVRTDPKKNLLRDPAQRNIPRLIVDDSIIKQAVRTPRIVTTNLDDDTEQTTKPTNQTNNDKKSNQINNESNPLANGYGYGYDPAYGYGYDYTNGGLTDQTKLHGLQYPMQYAEDEPPVDDYWKKEVLINDEGVVTIEPIKYDRNKYDGPFGLSRKGSYIFYISMIIITILAAVFLIMTGVFYGKSYPDSSANTAKIAGVGICAFVFYIGLMLILIGLWHQKYRQENPTQIITKSNKQHNDSSAHLKSTMEQNEQYDYSYQQPFDYSYQQPYDYSYGQQQYDYPPNETYSNPPYTANTNEMLLKQPGAATGAVQYDPVVWPSNVDIEGQPDPKFYQPMEWSVPQQSNGKQSTAPLPSVPVATVSNTKPEKKKKKHHHKKTVESNPPKATLDNLFPNSTATEEQLPVLNKAPETTELIKSIAEMEKNAQQNPKRNSVVHRNSSRIKPFDGETDISSAAGYRSNRNDRRHPRDYSHDRDHHQRRRRRSSYSSCSTCSYSSCDVFHSDVGFNRHNYDHQYSESSQRATSPRTHRTRTPSPPRTKRSTFHDTGVGTGRHHKTKDSRFGVDLEDVPNVRDNRLEQIPVVRRTIIVEPYPAAPTSQITIKPNTDTNGKMHLRKNAKLTDDNQTAMYPSTTLANKKSKKKNNLTNKQHGIMEEDLTLEDVMDNNEYDESTKSRKNKTTKTPSQPAKNAFYN